MDFTGSLDDALLDGTIDAAVHSGKDIPPQNRWRAGLAIAACLPRADVQDVLVGPYASFDVRVQRPVRHRRDPLLTARFPRRIYQREPG